MANRQRAEARRKAAAKAARQDGGLNDRRWITISIVSAVVVVLVVGGIFWFNRDSGSSGTNSASSSTVAVDGGLPTSQPVKVTGTPLAPYDSAVNPDPAVGKDVPVLEGKNFQGTPIVIDKSKGATMVVFLAHWCPHCNKEVPRLLDWKHSGQVPPGLNVVAVATAVSKTSVNYPPAQWFANKGWDWPVLVDESKGDGQAGVAADAYGATGWPYIVIFGADGKVKARVSGEIGIAELQKIVDAALKA
jgi:cytochrome c biogenesis protein CcmG/thiol:disulfide interchange protein DsbE